MTTTRLTKGSSLSTIAILFTCDDNYLPHAAACVASLVANNPDLFFDIAVVSVRPLGSTQKKFLQSFEKCKTLSIRFDVLDALSALRLPLASHYTVDSYLRLWIGTIFPEHERALYLDPDLIVTGSIRELWEVDLGCTVLGAVPIPASDRPQHIGLPPGTPYFNSGVILFDLNRWRDDGCMERCLAHIEAHPDKLFDPDQDVLNYCLANEWLPLPHKWNVISPFYYLSQDIGMTAAEIARVRSEAKIVHFNGHSKPWSYLCNHPRRAEYWKYIRMTEWHDLAIADRTLFNITKNSVGRVLPGSVKRAVRRVMAI
jgi:lipopolysaccharide biosynthesis glycosyltransferase